MQAQEWFYAHVNRDTALQLVQSVNTKLHEVATWKLVVGGAAVLVVVNYAKQTILRPKSVRVID